MERNAQQVLCHLQGHNGQNFRASASSDNMYANLDVVAHKLESQLLKEKTRLQRSKTRLTPHLRLIGENGSPKAQVLDDDDSFYEFEDYETSLRHVH